MLMMTRSNSLLLFIPTRHAVCSQVVNARSLSSDCSLASQAPAYTVVELFLSTFALDEFLKDPVSPLSSLQSRLLALLPSSLSSKSSHCITESSQFDQALLLVNPCSLTPATNFSMCIAVSS